MSKAKKQFRSQSANNLYRETLEAFEMDAHDLQTLHLACDCLDRIQAAYAVLDEHGDFIEDRYGGLKANPAARQLQQDKIIYARLIRELKLESGAAQDIRLPRLTKRG